MTASKNNNAYTLLEMLMVMTIVAIIFTIAIGSYISWGRSTNIATASRNCTTTLDLARQWAVTHRTPAIIDFHNSDSQGRYTISAITGDNREPILINPTNRLPQGVIFSDPTPDRLIFLPDGSAYWEPEDPLRCSIVMREYAMPEQNALASTVTVSRLSGYIEISE